MSYSWFLLALVVTVWGDAAASALRKDTDLASSFGGCAAAGLCCQGKNNTCRVRQRRDDIGDDDDGDEDDNSVLTLARRNTCFCDSACIELNDCCHDYKQTCARKFTRLYCKEFEEP